VRIIGGEQKETGIYRRPSTGQGLGGRMGLGATSTAVEV
jgi:hypothetical protein